MVLSQASETIKVFFSLAPASQDRNLFEQLRKHLSGLRRQGLIDIWYDSAISAGSNVRDIIRAYINQADIIVLLISADFFDSEQCCTVEMPYALEQHVVRAARVIPVLLRPTEWTGFSLEQYGPLPPNGKAVSVWSNLDTALTEVAKGIRRVVEELSSRLARTPRPVKPPQFPLYTVPHRQNPFFTDREDTLTILHGYFTSEQTTQTHIQALHGLAGIGKTLLAVEYASRYQHEYQAVLWLNATPRQLLSSDLLTLTRQLGIPTQDDVDEQERIAAIQRWLQRHDRWLLVLDNVEDFSILDQLVPLHSSGHVLLTTHAQATGPFAHAVSVTQMTINDGALLLLRRAKIIPEQGSRDATSETEYLQAVAIAQEFEGYPLALDQAGAYIEETQRSLASYLALYRERQATLLGMRGRLAKDHPDPVTTTLSLTFDKVAAINPNALELLRFFAFLHPEAIPDEMIMDGVPVLTGPLHALAVDSLALDDALATLRRFSLVHHRADTTMLNMHRIIQAVLKKHLTKKQQQQLANQAVRLVNATFPEVLFTTREKCERYVPQALYCATLISDFHLTLKEGPLLLERLGFYYCEHGCYTQAENYLTQALHLQERQRHTDRLDIAQTLNSLGLLFQRQARYHEASVHHQRALELRERVLGAEHPKTAESLHNLALIYEDLGEYQRAEQLYLHVLSIEEHAKGADHPDVASTLNNLALLYYHQGDYAQAETTYRRALTIYEHFLPADHPAKIHTLDGLGALAELQGNYQRAREIYEQELAICERALGEMHPETAHCINKLADIAESQVSYQQAEELYLRALSIGEQALGPGHPDVALFLNNLAFLLHEQGRYQRAEELYLRALSIYEQTLGPEHPDVASVLSNLGRLARHTKNEEHAEKLLRRALAIYEQRRGATHPDTAQCLSNLAMLLMAQQRDDEAEPLFQRALAILLQIFDSEHPDVMLVREKYASLLERMNRKEEATALRQAAQNQQKQPPADFSQSDQ